MSTNAQSAQEWLNNTKPDSKEIKAVIYKLERRIENAEEGADINGSIEALDLLQQVILDQEHSVKLITQSKTESLQSKEIPIFDISPLGDSPTINTENLSESERRERFLILKKSISNKT